MKKSRILIAFIVLVVSGCSGTEEWDIYSNGYNFTSWAADKGINAAEFIAGIDPAIKASGGNFERAELLLVMGRIKNDKGLVSFALDFYHKAEEDVEEAKNPYEKALLYETIASIDNTKYNQLKTAEAWRRAGDRQRALIHFNLAAGRKNKWEVSALEPANDVSYPPSFSDVTIGNTRIELGNDDFIVSQAELVSRDIDMLKIGSPFSETIKESAESGLIKELEAAGLKHGIEAGALVRKTDGVWYATNEEGDLMFEVPSSDVILPTTRFLGEDIAIVIDTNGVAMIAGKAVEKNATAVLGKCDSKGDADAAGYLSMKGIKVICTSGRYVPMLIGQNTKVVGSASLSAENGKAVFGSRPIAIRRDEPVIAMDTVSKGGMESSDAPARYFSELERKGAKLNVFIAEVDGFGQMLNVIKRAREKNANIIAVRVFDEDDYNIIKAWLEQDPMHKAILFASGKYGHKLSKEYRSQTSFDDPNPVVQ